MKNEKWKMVNGKWLGGSHSLSITLQSMNNLDSIPGLQSWVLHLARLDLL